MQPTKALDTIQLYRIIGGVIGNQVELAFEYGQFVSVGFEKSIVPGNQIASHRGFQVTHHFQHVVSVSNAHHGALDPVTDVEQEVDDGAEEKRAEETETEGHRHVAVEDSLEVILIDERVAHLVPSWVLCEQQ